MGSFCLHKAVVLESEKAVVQTTATGAELQIEAILAIKYGIYFGFSFQGDCTAHSLVCTTLTDFTGTVLPFGFSSQKISALLFFHVSVD